MPILNLSLSISSGKDISSLKIVILRSPKDIWKWSLTLIINSISNISFLSIEDLDRSILTSYILYDIPAAKYLSWGSNLTEWIFAYGSPSVNRWFTFIFELGINFILCKMRDTRIILLLEEDLCILLSLRMISFLQLYYIKYFLSFHIIKIQG